MKDIAIQLTSVSKSFSLDKSPVKRLAYYFYDTGRNNTKTALNNINLVVEKGEILGIVGNNGAGKSTLLKIISGVITPTLGQVEVFGKVAAILELQSGFNPDFSGIENIYFSGLIQGISKNDLDNSIHRIVEFADLGDYIYQPVRTYSSGMKSKLAFSIKTELEPDILILDEILSVGDVRFRKQAFDRLTGLINNRNATVIFVSHNIQSILQICDRAIWIHDGDILVDGTPKHTTAQYLRYNHTLKPVEDIKEELRAKNDKQRGIAETNAGSITSEPGNSVSLLEFLDPGLVADPQLHSGEGGLAVVNVQILNKNDQHVNNLLVNEPYRFKCTVKTKHDQPNIRFSLTIKNELGVVVSRKFFRDKFNGVQMASSESMDLCISFRNTLNSGYYYFDFGASSISGTTANYVTSLQDVYCVKVNQPSENSQFEGMVDFFSAWENI